jgi:hypothetical protein
MNWLPSDMIDALAIAWLEWLILRPAYLSHWGCLLEVHETGKRANSKTAGRDP